MVANKNIKYFSYICTMRLLLITLLLPLFMVSQENKTGFLLVNENFIPLDKQMHGAAGIGLGGMSYIVTRFPLNKSRATAIAVGITVPTLAGLGKELLDARAGGTGFDRKDLLYTALFGTATTIGLDLLIGSDKKIAFRRLPKKQRKVIRLNRKIERKQRKLNKYE